MELEQHPPHSRWRVKEPGGVTTCPHTPSPSPCWQSHRSGQVAGRAVPSWRSLRSVYNAGRFFWGGQPKHFSRAPLFVSELVGSAAACNPFDFVRKTRVGLLAGSVERMTLDFGVISSSPMVGVVIT